MTRLRQEYDLFINPKTLAYALQPNPPPPFHWTAIPPRYWRSQIFSKKYSKSPRKRRQPHDLETWCFRYASATIPLRQWRSGYAKSTLMATQLRPCYDLGDGATFSLRFCILSIWNLKFNLFIFSWMSTIGTLKSLCFSWPLWTTDYWSRSVKRS